MTSSAQAHYCSFWDLRAILGSSQGLGREDSGQPVGVVWERFHSHLNAQVSQLPQPLV